MKMRLDGTILQEHGSGFLFIVFGISTEKYTTLETSIRIAVTETKMSLLNGTRDGKSEINL